MMAIVTITMDVPLNALLKANGFAQHLLSQLQFAQISAEMVMLQSQDMDIVMMETALMETVAAQLAKLKPTILVP